MLPQLAAFSLSVLSSSLADFQYPLTMEIGECFLVRMNVGEGDQIWLLNSRNEVALEIYFLYSKPRNYLNSADTNGKWYYEYAYCDSMITPKHEEKDFYIFDDGKQWTVCGQNWTCSLFEDRPWRATDVVRLTTQHNPVTTIGKCCDPCKYADLPRQVINV